MHALHVSSLLGTSSIETMQGLIHSLTCLLTTSSWGSCWRSFFSLVLILLACWFKIIALGTKSSWCLITWNEQNLRGESSDPCKQEKILFDKNLTRSSINKKDFLVYKYKRLFECKILSISLFFIKFYFSLALTMVITPYVSLISFSFSSSSQSLPLLGHFLFPQFRIIYLLLSSLFLDTHHWYTFHHTLAFDYTFFYSFSLSWSLLVLINLCKCHNMFNILKEFGLLNVDFDELEEVLLVLLWTISLYFNCLSTFMS